MRRSHTRAFAALGGVPKLLVPDNTKVAVITACLYEPQVNRTYAEMAAHYDTAILPGRPRRPRDKAKVEVAVLIIERWLLGRLRHRRFYSLAELNAVLGELLRQLNDERLIRRLGVTRRALFEELGAGREGFAAVIMIRYDSDLTEQIAERSEEPMVCMTLRWREVDSNFRSREDESSIETPLGHKDHSWSFLHFDTITVTVADAPRPCLPGILGLILIRTTRRQRMIRLS